MQHSSSLPLFYGCLVLFTIFVVFFEEHEEQTFHMMDYTSDASGGFRSPKIWDQIPQENYKIDNETVKRTVFDEEGGRRRDAAPATYLEEMPKEFCFPEEGLDLQDPKLKKILIWNSGYGTKTMSFGYGRAPFRRAECEVDLCLTTSNRSLLPVVDFDAVIFHFRATERLQMPRSRSPHQRWIFEEVESSSYIYQDPAIYNSLFNWTMTYRRDSDIVYTYGRVYPSPSPSPVPKDKNFAEGKTKMAAWFVSNCYSHSKRERIVKSLQSYIKVDIYGKCGPLECPRDSTRQCYQMLEENYKFYLSFENSLCKDYVTEKLFSVLKYNVVPVVYGLADYALVAPPGSYIDALSFPSVDSLAKYLKYLDGNDTAYNEYFRWKGQYTIDNGWSNTAQGFCDLCKKLHQDSEPKVYRDIKDWFMLSGGCKTLKSRSWLPWL
ncbi:alpha-(1,3)-fucosyltransferase C [Penaeus vannamei]|uniref:alpha-(1,3)-fucosyltransferase C n=1 Tax=Penaeus vannamei TaxID=6689 RepID=UPI00387FA5CA